MTSQSLTHKGLVVILITTQCEGICTSCKVWQTGFDTDSWIYVDIYFMQFYVVILG
jgi:hypothetical protein